MQVVPLQMTQLVQRMHQTVAETFLNNAYLNEVLTYRGVQTTMFPLSSLSEDDWTEYARTGRIPDTYQPGNDIVLTWYYT